MGWKMFGSRRRLSSPRDKVFNLIRAIGKRDLGASSDASKDPRQPNSLDPRAYIIAKQRMHEIDGQKAMIIHELRHEFWKAGGPV